MLLCACQVCACTPLRKWLNSIRLHVAGFSRRLQLLGISTVAANQTVDKVTDNALRICEAAGLAHIGAHMPVYNLAWLAVTLFVINSRITLIIPAERFLVSCSNCAVLRNCCDCQQLLLVLQMW